MCCLVVFCGLLVRVWARLGGLMSLGVLVR